MVDEDKLGLTVFEDVLDVGGLEAGVDQVGNGAGSHYAEISVWMVGVSVGVEAGGRGRVMHLLSWV